MKKVILFVLIMALSLSPVLLFVGCEIENPHTTTTTDGGGSTTTQPNNGGGNLSGMSCLEILERVLDDVPQEGSIEWMKDMLPFAEDTAAVKDRLLWHFGISTIQITEAAAVEPAMLGGWSIVVARLADGQNFSALKTQVHDAIDPYKWICVGGDSKRVEVVGNVMIVIITNQPYTNNIAQAFLALG